MEGLAFIDDHSVLSDDDWFALGHDHRVEIAS
jgi:hypothetical protein